MVDAGIPGGLADTFDETFEGARFERKACRSTASVRTKVAGDFKREQVSATVLRQEYHHRRPLIHSVASSHAEAVAGNKRKASRVLQTGAIPGVAT